MGLAILFYLYRHLELADTLRLLQHGVRYEYLLLSLPLGLLGNATRGYRWHLLMRPLYTPPARSINPILVTIGSYAVNFVIPRAGEVWRCTEMKQREGYALSATVGTLLIDRLSDAVVVLALLVAMMLFQPGSISQILAARGLSLGGGLGRLFSSDYATAWIIAGVSLLVIILVLYRFRKSSFMQRVKEKLRSVLQAASTLRGWCAWSQFVVLTLLLWLFYYYFFYIAFGAFAFTADLGHRVAFASFVLSTLMIAIPTPAGVGPWHYAVIISLTAFGVSEAEAGQFALIVHVVQTLWTIAVGVIAILILPIINRTYKRVEEGTTEINELVKD